MEKAFEMMIPVTMFAMTFGIVYVAVTARHREKMAMIEKGVDPALFNLRKRRNHDGNLKWGIIVVMVALGIIIGNVVHKTGALQEEVATSSIPLLFGGLGLLIFYFLRKAKNEQDEARDNLPTPQA